MHALQRGGRLARAAVALAVAGAILIPASPAWADFLRGSVTMPGAVCKGDVAHLVANLIVHRQTDPGRYYWWWMDWGDVSDSGNRQNTNVQVAAGTDHVYTKTGVMHWLFHAWEDPPWNGGLMGSNRFDADGYISVMDCDPGGTIGKIVSMSTVRQDWNSQGGQIQFTVNQHPTQNLAYAITWGDTANNHGQAQADTSLGVYMVPPGTGTYTITSLWHTWDYYSPPVGHYGQWWVPTVEMVPSSPNDLFPLFFPRQIVGSFVGHTC